MLQGLSLPRLILALQLPADVEEEREEIEARLAAADAAVKRLDELEGEDWVNDDTAERMRGLYAFRRRRFEARLDDGDDGEIEERSQSPTSACGASSWTPSARRCETSSAGA